MSAKVHADTHASGTRITDGQNLGTVQHDHGQHLNLRELYGTLPESSPYRHVRGVDEEAQSVKFPNPFKGSFSEASAYLGSRGAPGQNSELQEGDKRADHAKGIGGEREKLLSSTEQKVEGILKSNPHDFRGVFSELDKLQQKDGKNIEGDLKHLNDHLHESGLLKGLSIIGDDREGGHGWAVVAEDKANKERYGHRDGTMVSTSHEAHESQSLEHHYHSMHYRRGHYNGWHQSVEGGGGAHGGFDGNAVGGHVPPGARRELIEKALQLAGVPVSEQNISAVNKIVMRESGWNPNITNHWDSNAKAGHPSTGLMQTIPSTFKSFALPGMNNNIHDPLSNLVAGIRYAEHRYGRHGVSGVARVASRPGGY